MTDIKPLLRAGMIMQSGALLGYNYKLLRKKKKTAKDFLKAGATNILGTSLLKEESNFIEGF